MGDGCGDNGGGESFSSCLEQRAFRMKDSVDARQHGKPLLVVSRGSRKLFALHEDVMVGSLKPGHEFKWKILVNDASEPL
jgi:hypothetical protein